MKYILVSPCEVSLRGISRASSFQIVNNNDFLAVSFRISCDHPDITIFPEKGMLLCREEQSIKIKLKMRDHSFSEEKSEEKCASVKVESSCRIQYNRRYLESHQMSGWKDLLPQNDPSFVSVRFTHEKELIQSQIKEAVCLNNNFARDSSSISSIDPVNQSKQLPNDQSLLNLELDVLSKEPSQKYPKTQKYRNKEFNEVNRQEVSIFLEQPKHKNESASRALSYSPKKQSFLQQIKLTTSQMIADQRHYSKLETVKNQNSFMNQISNLSHADSSHSNDRNCQLFILAIIAAFFVALGANFAKLFR